MSKKLYSNDDKAKWAVQQASTHNDLILIIDDCTCVTTSNRPWLETLCERSVVIAATDEKALKRPGTKRFWKRFDEIPIPPLSREESSQMLDLLIERYGIAADEPEIYRRKIVDLAQGSPFELQRLVKYHSTTTLVKTNEISEHVESFVERDTPQLALAPLLIIGLILIASTRYVARAKGDLDMWIISGAALVAVILFGPWIRKALKPRSG